MARRGSGSRVAFLLAFLVAHAVPPLIEAGLASSGQSADAARGMTAAFVVVAGVVGLLAAFSGPRDAGASRALGAALVVVAAGLEIAYAYGGVSWPQAVQVVALSSVFLAWYLGWLLPAAAPPRAYVGVLVLAAAIALQLLVPYLLLRNGVWDPWTLIGSTVAATVVLTLAVVGLTVAIARSAPAREHGSPAAPLPEPGPVRPLANLALGLGLGAIGALLLSFGLGFVTFFGGILVLILGVAYLALVVGAIVAGHLARVRLRRDGGSGWSRALAGLVIGYVLAGLSVAGVVTQIVVWQVALTSMSSYASDEYDDGDYSEDEIVVDDEPVAEVAAPSGPTCEQLFSSSVVADANAFGLVLNPPWADGTDPGGLALQDPELAQLVATSSGLDCRWLTPGGGSGYGIRTTVIPLDSSTAAWVSGRLAGLGYASQSEAQGTRYFFEASADGSAYGESHMVVGGVWFATHWVEYGPRGYTVDVVTNYFS